MLKSKLLKVKKWLSLDEAALRLSSVLEEKVTILDLLEFGLEGHLVLTVRLPYSAKHVGIKKEDKLIKYSEELKKQYAFFKLSGFDSNNEYIEKLKSVPKEIKELSDVDQYIYIKYLDYIKDYADRFSSEEESTFEFFSEKIMFSSRKSIGDLYYLDDVLYDLPMIGAERLDIEFLYEINRGKEAPEMVNLDGVFLKDENGDLINLLERFDEEIVKKNRNRRKDKTLKLHGGDYFPAGGLPEGYEIGVRPKNLSEFEQSLSDDSEEFTDIQYLLLVANMLDLVTSKAKKWTQGDLAASISDKKIKGIGERTINGIFAKANSLNKSIG